MAYDRGIGGSPWWSGQRSADLDQGAGRILVFQYLPMEEDLDSLVVALALIERFGAEAAPIAEQRAAAHRRAEESEGAEFWQHAADVVRRVLTVTEANLNPHRVRP